MPLLNMDVWYSVKQADVVTSMPGLYNTRTVHSYCHISATNISKFKRKDKFDYLLLKFKIYTD